VTFARSLKKIAIAWRIVSSKHLLRRLGAVPRVPRWIDERRSTLARRALARQGLASLRCMNAATLRCLAHWPSSRFSTKQPGQLGILVMGSVAQKVVYHATVPVTLVK